MPTARHIASQGVEDQAVCELVAVGIRSRPASMSPATSIEHAGNFLTDRLAQDVERIRRTHVARRVDVAAHVLGAAGAGKRQDEGTGGQRRREPGKLAQARALTFWLCS